MTSRSTPGNLTREQILGCRRRVAEAGLGVVKA